TCVLFFLPAFVFASPYAAVGGMTIAHGLQYLLLVTSIAGGRTAAAGNRRSRPVRLALLANVAFIGGAALSSASPLHHAGTAGGAAGRAAADAAGALETLGRSSGPASLILSSLADGPSTATR